MSTLADFETTSTAIRLGKAEQGSDEWHRLRSEDNAIGGSEIGVLLGLSQFESPYARWAKRKGLIADTVQTDAMEWGHRLEPVIAAKFAELHDGELFTDLGTYAHKGHNWQRANPDGLLWTGERWELLEVKTARDETYWKDEHGVLEVPATYRAQVQWYLATLGLEVAHVAVLFAGSRYYEFVIDANEFEQDLAYWAAVEFRKLLESDETPELTAPFTSTMEVLRKQHPEINADDAVELGDLGLNYWTKLQELDRVQKEADEYKAHVLEAMGGARRGLINDVWQFTRQARKGGIPYLVSRKS